MDKIKYIKLLNDIASEFIEKEGNLSHKSLLRFFERIQNQQDYLVMLTTSDSDFEELSEVLKFSFPIIDDIVDCCIDSDDAKKAIFDIGRLYGALQLSSRICYEKKKDYQVYETALAVCGIKCFDEIISLLDSQEELTQTEICKKLNMRPSEFIKSIEKLIDENLVVSRRSGEFKAYALSDDGLRFARLRSIEKEHEERITSAISNQKQDSLSTTEIKKLHKIIEKLEKMISSTEWLSNYSKDFDYSSYNLEYLNDGFNSELIIEPRNNMNK